MDHHLPVRTSREVLPARSLPPGMRRFLDTEAASGLALVTANDLSDEPTARELREMTTMAKETVSVAERVQHTLHPITSYAVVPVFALANAGVPLTTDALDAPGTATVAAGVILGLIVGKTIGITAASAVAIR